MRASTRVALKIWVRAMNLSNKANQSPAASSHEQRTGKHSAKKRFY
jgi:hypothetical protein